MPKRGRRPGDEPIADRSQPLLLRGEAIVAAVLVFAVVGGAALAFLVAGGGGDDPQTPAEPPVEPPAGDTPSAGDDGGAEIDSADRKAIEELARRSIESLPEGEWPSLYPYFTVAFQARCPIEQFTQVAEQTTLALGADLERLRFVRLEDLRVTDDRAEGVVVGELDDEYRVNIRFRHERGEWRISPAPNTDGCDAFDRH